MSLRDDLIAVYGPTPVADVEASAAYAAVRARYPGTESFRRVKHEVEQAKTYLERVLGDQEPAQQVKKAVWELLRRRRRPPERDLFYGLIAGGYRDNANNDPQPWNDEQKRHFDRAWRLIQLEYDFFLSFTSRFEDVAGDNPVNTRYEHFIRREISDAEYQAADRRKHNLFAMAIHRLLSDPQHRGFFYPHSTGANKAVRATLEAALRSSVVFVQIVQNALFVEPASPADAPEAVENYCYWEYTRALEAYGDDDAGRLQIGFVGAEGAYEKLVKAFHVPPPYERWYNHAGNNSVPYLEGTPKFDPDAIEARRQTVLTKVKPMLDEVWDRLLTSVPH